MVGLGPIREEIIGLQKDEDRNPEDRVRYNTHLRELVESVSVALARSVASEHRGGPVPGLAFNGIEFGPKGQNYGNPIMSPKG